MTLQRDQERTGRRRLWTALFLSGTVALGIAGWFIFGIEVGIAVLFVGAFASLGARAAIQSRTGDSDQEGYIVRRAAERSLMDPTRAVSDPHAESAQSVHHIDHGK